MKNTKKHRRQKTKTQNKAHREKITSIVMVLVGVLLLGFILAGVVTVTLSPVNYTNSSTQQVINCSATTTASEIQNISLYTNESGDFEINDTNILSLDGSVLHHYKFDDNDLTDLVGTLDGVNTGTTNISGLINSARYFEDTETINFSASSNYDAVTYSFWFKTNNSNGGTATDGSEVYTKGVADNKEVITIKNREITYRSNPASGQQSKFSTNSANLLNDTWYHFVVTGDGDTDSGEYSLFLNGVNQTISESIAGVNTSRISGSTVSYLGGVRTGATSYYGTIDELTIFNRTIDTTEIENLYNGGDGDYSIAIESTSSLFNYNFTDVIAWNCLVCDDEDDCSFAPVNSSNPLVFENSNTYNTTSLETAYETFILNASYNSSLTAVALDYEGTEISATLSGGLWTSTKSILTSDIGTNQLRWKFTYSGDTFYSYNFTQEVGFIEFGLCNTTLDELFLNLSFKDEADDGVINASIPTSTWVYYLGNGTTNKTFSYINATNNYNYTFCGNTQDNILKVVPTIQYKKDSDYPQRTWSPSFQSYINDTYTNQTLYLLGAADGIYVTFQIVNTASQTISGVEILANRSIGGVDTTIGQGTTGDDGALTLWLNPDFIHDFSFTKEGFTSYETSFAPTQTSYTITMGGEGVVPKSYFKGINYEITPTNTSLVNDTIYSFGFLLTSSYWDLDEYGFNLRLSNGTIITGSTTTTSGTQLSVNYNTTNQSIIYMDYYWIIDGDYTNLTKQWKVYDIDNTQWSIKTFFTDLNTYMDTEMFGLDNFGRYLIIFLVIFLSVGIMSYKYGFTSPLTVLTSIFLIVFFLDVVVGIIPVFTLGLGRELPYVLTFLTALILIIFIIKEASK